MSERRRPTFVFLAAAIAASSCLAPGARPAAGTLTHEPPRADAAAAATGHPRLWVRAAELPRLRSWAAGSNPVWARGLAVLAANAKREMDAGHVPAGDGGSAHWEEYPSESYAELFAFLSLVAPGSSARADYARRARTILMHVMREAAKGPAEGRPFRHPDFATNDRSRWTGEGWALTVDWIYPALSASDRSTIRTVFLRWAREIETDGYHPPRPAGAVNDPALVRDREEVRWAANNYFTAHMRNLGLMAMAFDPPDDPGGELRRVLRRATGAWLYVLDHLLRRDSRGGMAPEGFEYSPQSMGYAIQFLWALRTAGEDDPARWGRQVVLRDNPFWRDFVTAYLHSLSPAPSEHEWMGPVYRPAWYGDGQTYLAPDFIGAMGPLGLYRADTGDAAAAAEARWIQRVLPPGGSAGFPDRITEDSGPRDAILYFLLFDPSGATRDPRPSRPLSFFAPGSGKILARTSWGSGATWFTYGLGWLTIDHQHADGNMIELYRKGEWLTKERTGYGETIQASDYHNTLAILNDAPDHRGDYREIMWRRGSQWIYHPPSEDPRIVARSFGAGFVYASGDATALYNSEHEVSDDVTHASRSVVWLKPDVVVVYDRAASRTAGRFKRVWLNLPGPASVSGRRATARTRSGQQLFVTTLLPSDAAIRAEAAEPLRDEVAHEEPMTNRLRIEAPGGPREAAFLNVLEGADRGAARSGAALVRSSAGTPFAGAAVRGVAVLFPVRLGGGFSGLTYTVPSSAARHLITGLAPGGRYDAQISRSGAGVTVRVSPGSARTADSGGVLDIRL